MLVYWIPNTEHNTIPANASHKVRIGAFVMDDRRQVCTKYSISHDQRIQASVIIYVTYIAVQVLVVQEKNGKLRGLGVWKLPTGTVDEVTFSTRMF